MSREPHISYEHLYKAFVLDLFTLRNPISALYVCFAWFYFASSLTKSLSLL